MSSISLLLIEHENDNDNGQGLCVWSYPDSSIEIRTACIIRCGSEGKHAPFIYFKLKNDWVYCLTMPLGPNIIPDVSSASICACTRSFNPEKFNAFLMVLFEQYLHNGDPTKILEGYLSIHTTGNFSNQAGTFDTSLYKDDTLALSSNSTCLQELNDMLGIEFAVLWNAVLLKKRILVIADDCDKLLPIVRILPLLASHRTDNYQYLRPLVSSDKEFLDDLSSCGVFIAGTLDKSLSAKSELYDVLLSLQERRVNVTQHAMSSMKMCSIHKEVAQLVATAAGDLATRKGSKDTEILKTLSQKTATIISNLKSLSTDKLNEDIINENVSNASTQQWLVRLATAEGLI
jgi:hypothetical protein